MHDPFVGTWKLNPARSQFDANHKPREGTLQWQLEPDGAYLMLAEGRNEKGDTCTERPQRLVPDGEPHPIPDFPGLTSITSRPDPNTIQGRVFREDGSVVGEASYVVAEDGLTMTATTAGFDSQFRRFEMRTAWDRH